jgi:hypothetical protein
MIFHFFSSVLKSVVHLLNMVSCMNLDMPICIIYNNFVFIY